MGTVINFNQAKKKLARLKKQKEARENRTLFGRAKLAKIQAKKAKKAAQRQLDDHKLGKSGEKGEN